MNNTRTSLPAANSVPGPRAIPRLRASTAIILVESGVATLVGVASGKDAAEGRIEGAVVATTADLDERPEAVLDRIPLSHTVILYASDLDERSGALAARALIRAGCPRERLALLTGEPIAWERAGFSVIRAGGAHWHRH